MWFHPGISPGWCDNTMIMSIQSDALIDRRRLKRRLIFWRIIGVSAIALAIIAAIGRFDGFSTGKDRVARIAVEGIILDDPVRDEALDEIAKDDRIKALVVTIDSPGGTFVGGEALYFKLRKIAAEKPVAALMGGTATSAAYMAAIATDRVFARAGTLTGSIGVILQTADITGLLGQIGIKPEIIKSGPLKAQPNPMEPFSDAARAATESVVQDFFEQFVDMVTERRDLTRAQVMTLADGRIFSGRQAKTNGLVDAMGSLEEARSWLADEKNISKDLPLVDVAITHEDEPWRDMFSGIIGKTLFSERLRLDGVISLWHPALKL
jgi:protease IV